MKAIRLIFAFAAVGLSRAKRVRRLLRRECAAPAQTQPALKPTETAKPTQSPTRPRKKPKRTSPTQKSERTSPRRTNPTSRRSRRLNRKNPPSPRISWTNRQSPPRTPRAKTAPGPKLLTVPDAAGHLDGVGSAVRRHRQRRRRRAAQPAAIHPVNHAAAAIAAAAPPSPPARPHRRWRWRQRQHLAARRRRGQASHRSCAQGPDGRSDQRREHDLRSRRPQARRVGDPAQRRGRPRFPALRGLHRGQSELAVDFGAAPARRGGALAAASRPAHRHRVFPKRSAAHARRDDSRWRARCLPKATAPARRRRCAKRGARTASPPTWRRRRATCLPA